MNDTKLLRVMVSLNLADIMTATRPTTPQEVDPPTDAGQESQLTTNSEQNLTADNTDEIRI